MTTLFVLDVPENKAVAAVADGWPGERSFEVPTTAPKPKLSQAEIDRFAEDDLAPLVSAPVKVTTTDPKGSGAAKNISLEDVGRHL